MVKVLPTLGLAKVLSVIIMAAGKKTIYNLSIITYLTNGTHLHLPEPFQIMNIK
jgi:hypothetical protein